MAKKRHLAVVGATGAVGEAFRQVLQDREFPYESIRFVASARSAGKRVMFAGKRYTVQELARGVFDGVDLALFSIPKDLSRKWAPRAVEAGAVVVDNSNAFRMEPDVPLVIPEVNPEDVANHKGIIANPNCSTIGMVVALNPLHKVAGIKRVVVTTMQSVSGASREAVLECLAESRAVLAGKKYVREIFPHQIAFNCLPQIPQADAFDENGYTSEEMKLLHETRKIMHAPQIRVTMTCVRVPVIVGHSEAVNIEFEKPLSADEAREILSAAPGVVVQDDPSKEIYPLATEVEGKDETYVGRIRQDFTIPDNRGLNIWVVTDNLRKGAATNAVQIAELLIK
ncbi:MAG: aspartate-semialdehyde dehydrogenase [Planctomycetia bacterium]|nr:aspartate-semialdehyde dehydrogenase [Planctomycetia bacterium]